MLARSVLISSRDISLKGFWRSVEAVVLLRSSKSVRKASPKISNGASRTPTQSEGGPAGRLRPVHTPRHKCSPDGIPSNEGFADGNGPRKPRRLFKRNQCPNASASGSVIP